MNLNNYFKRLANFLIQQISVISAWLDKKNKERMQHRFLFGPKYQSGSGYFIAIFLCLGFVICLQSFLNIFVNMLIVFFRIIKKMFEFLLSKLVRNNRIS